MVPLRDNPDTMDISESWDMEDQRDSMLLGYQFHRNYVIRCLGCRMAHCVKDSEGSKSMKALQKRKASQDMQVEITDHQ